ncbi:hypothetical protein ACHAXS_007505 [Conticribra weissflogii]
MISASTTSNTSNATSSSSSSSSSSSTSTIRLSRQLLQNSHVDIPPATLFVKVSRATHLYRNVASPRLALNPYMKITYGKNSSRSVTHLRARAAKKDEGICCDFEFCVSFPFDPERDPLSSSSLLIEVWDQHYGKKDEVLGYCILPSKDLVEYHTQTSSLRRNVPLVHKGRLTGLKTDGGFLELEVHWEHHSVFITSTSTCTSNDHHHDDEHPNQSMEIVLQSLRNLTHPPQIVDLPLPTLCCVTNFNRLSGVVQTLVDNGTIRKYAPFRTYNMRLWHVPLVFGSYAKGWNRDYKAARQIYGPTQSAAMMRSALRLQNYMAYSNDYLNSDHEVHQISGMRSLFDMLAKCHASDATADGRREDASPALHLRHPAGFASPLLRHLQTPRR